MKTPIKYIFGLLLATVPLSVIAADTSQRVMTADLEEQMRCGDYKTVFEAFLGPIKDLQGTPEYDRVMTWLHLCCFRDDTFIHRYAPLLYLIVEEHLEIGDCKDNPRRRFSGACIAFVHLLITNVGQEIVELVKVDPETDDILEQMSMADMVVPCNLDEINTPFEILAYWYAQRLHDYCLEQPDQAINALQWAVMYVQDMLKGPIAQAPHFGWLWSVRRTAPVSDTFMRGGRCEWHYEITFQMPKDIEGYDYKQHVTNSGAVYEAFDATIQQLREYLERLLGCEVFVERKPWTSERCANVWKSCKAEFTSLFDWPAGVVPRGVDGRLDYYGDCVAQMGAQFLKVFIGDMPVEQG